MTHLFVNGTFTTSAGDTLPWKIDCDALTKDDWDTIAYQISQKFQFCGVYGIPSGGAALADALAQYVSPTKGYPFLIVDDVLTTGQSMEDAKAQFASEYKSIVGVVLFSRMQTTPRWILPFFNINQLFNK